jgi:hypothetical protein
VIAAIEALLRQILHQLWAEGFELGTWSANRMLGTELAAEVGALDRLIEQAGPRIAGMAQTRLSQVEAILENAPADATVADIADAVEDDLGAEWRAIAVTQTETTWSMAEGMLGVFYQAGAQTMAWLTAGDERVCPTCDANASMGYIPAGEAFYSGDTQPPAHVLCRCCLVPGDINGWSLPTVPLPGLSM